MSSFNDEAIPPKEKTNKAVIRLAGLRLMLVESDARKAIDAIETGRIDLARVYLAGVVETMQKVYLKDVEE